MSPMRRTIETAWYIFKDHPNFKNILFKINPDIREKILIGGDVPIFNSYEMILTEYVPMWEEKGSKIEFDKQLLEPNFSIPW